MKVIRNEKGGLLIYALFLILLISVITVPLLNMSSTRVLADVRDKNQKIATTLAVSAAEQYLSYLSSCDTPCTDMERYKTRYFLNGLTDFPRMMSITLDDGTPVTFSMHYEQDPTHGVRVITRTVAGDTNRDGIPNEKLARMKEIIYNLNGKKIVKKLIDPNTKTEVIDTSEKIYLDPGSGGNIGNIPESQTISNLQVALTNYLKQQTNTYEQQISEYKQTSLSCSTLSCINTTIQNTTSEPIVIKLGSMQLSSYNNTSGKKVVFVFNNFSTNFTGSNVDIVVDHLDLPSNFTLTNGNLLIAHSIDLNNNGNITINGGDLYAKTFSPSKDNGIQITANKFVVSETFDIKNNAKLDIKDEFVVGTVKVGNNATLECTAGDFFVASNLTAGNNTNLTAGGSIAVGGNVNVGTLTVEAGGGSTILNPEASEGDEMTEEEIIWLPTRP